MPAAAAAAAAAAADDDDDDDDDAGTVRLIADRTWLMSNIGAIGRCGIAAGADCKVHSIAVDNDYYFPLTSQS